MYLEPPVTYQPRDPMAMIEVMTNYDHTIRREVAERLKVEPLLAMHPGTEFCGTVWWNPIDEVWHEAVQVHGSHVGTYSADTLDDLMKIVNDRYGWA